MVVYCVARRRIGLGDAPETPTGGFCGRDGIVGLRKFYLCLCVFLEITLFSLIIERKKIVAISLKDF